MNTRMRNGDPSSVNMIRRWMLSLICCVAGALSCAGAAMADAPRNCEQTEIAQAKRGPMPKVFDSIARVTTAAPRFSAFLIDVGADGRPTVLCTIDNISDPKLNERAAEAISDFEYWPADQTVPEAPYFIHITSDPSGLGIPSILPRKDSPLCVDVKRDPAGKDAMVEPIYRVPVRYPYHALRKSKTGETNVVLTVTPSGAVALECRATGDNPEMFKIVTYYAAAQFRFPPAPGSPPRYYALTIHFKMEP